MIIMQCVAKDWRQGWQELQHTRSCWNIAMRISCL